MKNYVPLAYHTAFLTMSPSPVSLQVNILSKI